MGAAQAGVFPCATKAIGATFPQGERARASGMLAAGMTIGAAVAPMITSLALEALMPASQATGVERWRLLLVAYALPGFAWVLLFWFMVPNALLPVSPLGSAPDPVDWCLAAFWAGLPRTGCWREPVTAASAVRGLPARAWRRARFLFCCLTSLPIPR